MIASVSRVTGASNWLATSAYAYSAFVASTRFVTTTARWAAALIAAIVVYLLVMLALAAFWQHDSAHAAAFCAGGMAVAVLCGAWAASAMLLPRHRAAGAWVCCILGMLYPMLLAAASQPGAPVQAMQLLYVVASAAGGFAALWTPPLARSVMASHTANALERSGRWLVWRV
jgi:uncharacterized membrane protein